MKRWAIVAGLTTVALLVSLNVKMRTAQGNDEPEFSLRTIEGTWGFSGDGVLAGPSPEDWLPTAGVGIITFDGEGGCEISTTTQFNGTAFSSTSEFCTYTVNPDGTGTSEASFAAVGPLPATELPVAFVIVDQGRELRFIQTAFIVSDFIAKRVEGARSRYRRR